MRSIHALYGSSLAIVAAVGIGAGACDATGETRGGQAVIADPCASPSLEPTWTNLYMCYFGPSGQASCSGQSTCHGSATELGARARGFVCGATAADCWRGMTQWRPADCELEGGADAMAETSTSDAMMGDAASADGAVDAHDGGNASDASGEGDAMDATDEASPPICWQPIVTTGGTSDPTQTILWSALRGVKGVPGLHDMPLFPSSFTWSQQDLDRISAWIKQGAKDN